MKWVLFALMFATFPVLYFMFVIAGLLPLSAIVAMSFRGQPGFIVFNIVHVVFYSPILFLAAWAISKGLAKLPPAVRYVAFAMNCAALVGLAFLPIYGVGHNAYTPVTLSGLTRMLR